MKRLARASALIATALAAMACPTAQSAEELTLKNSVVHLSVSGRFLREDGTLTNVCRRSGTGFLISADGFVLTARHLFQAQNLGDIDDCGGDSIGLDKLLNTQVEINAKIGNSTGNISNSAPIPAERFVSDSYTTNALFDVALLRLTETPPGAVPLTLCKESLETPTNYAVELFGFPAPSLVIVKRNGLKAQVADDWRWNLAIPLVDKARGFSGAPVLNANGDVVAMFRGGDDRTSNWYYATPVAQFETLAGQNTGVTIDACKEVRPFREQVLDKLKRRGAGVEMDGYFAGSGAAYLFDGSEDSFGASPYRFDVVWGRSTSDEVVVSANAPTLDVVVMRNANGQQFNPRTINVKFADAIVHSPKSRRGLKSRNRVGDDEWFLLRNKENHFALVRIVAIGDREFDPSVKESFVAYDYWILRDEGSVDFSIVNLDLFE